jgi:hypothetical protein
VLARSTSADRDWLPTISRPPEASAAPINESPCQPGSKR